MEEPTVNIAGAPAGVKTDPPAAVKLIEVIFFRSTESMDGRIKGNENDAIT